MELIMGLARAIYRKNGGEVLAKCIESGCGGACTCCNPTEWYGISSDVTDTGQNMGDGYWSDGTSVSLATQEQKDAWPAAAAADLAEEIGG
jgi:hypothetical protein